MCAETWRAKELPVFMQRGGRASAAGAGAMNAKPPRHGMRGPGVREASGTLVLRKFTEAPI